MALGDRERLRWWLGLGLLALVLILTNLVADRYAVRLDWSARKIHKLSPQSLAVLRGLSSRVTFHMVMSPPHQDYASLMPQTSELLQRFRLASRQVSVRRVDQDLDPAAAALLVERHDLNRADLREGGVLVTAAKRSHFVGSASMAELQASDGRVRVASYRGEAALLGALAQVLRPPTTLCFTSGHGEAPPRSYQEAGYGRIVDELRRYGYGLRVLTPQKLIAPALECRLLVIGGPRRGFAPVEVDALARYLKNRGRIFALLGPVLDRKGTRHRTLGLAPMLRQFGVQIGDRIVVDPLALPGEQPMLSWATREGYVGDHPVARALRGKLTVWPLAREVSAVVAKQPGVQSVELVQTSDRGWAEADLRSLRGEQVLRMDPAVDRPGPVGVAVAAWSAAGTRLVVLGSERGVLNRRLAEPTLRDHNVDLFMAAVQWLDGQDRWVKLGPRVPQRVRLLLDRGQLSRVFLMVVVVMPCCAVVCGVLVWRRRRRQ